MLRTFADLKKFDDVVVEALGPEGAERFRNQESNEQLAAQLQARYPEIVKQVPPIRMSAYGPVREKHVVLLQVDGDVGTCLDEDSGAYQLRFLPDGSPSLTPFVTPSSLPSRDH